MTKHFYTLKKLPLFLAVSAVILIAGIVLFALFGFNYDAQAGKSFEVTYDAVVTISDGCKSPSCRFPISLTAIMTTMYNNNARKNTIILASPLSQRKYATGQEKYTASNKN